MTNDMTDTATETVAVIVPTFNGARYLAETIEAILAQTRPADDVVIVDDGSTDDSARIADGYAPDLRVLRVAHAGTSASRHRGYEATTAGLLANCDSDDLWLPTKLERQVEVLRDRPDLDAVGTLLDEFMSPDASPASRPGRGLRSRARSTQASSLLVRRSFLDRLGGYGSAHELGEYVDWYARALSAGLRADLVDEVLVRRRLHDHNSSRSFATDSDQYLTIMRDHLERNRKDSP